MDGQKTEQGNIIFINIPSNENVFEGKMREEINNSPYYAVKSYRGKVNHNKLSFDQVRILKKESSSRTNWCLFKSELVYNDSTGYLEGRFFSTNCRNFSGKIMFYRSNATFSEDVTLILHHSWIEDFKSDLAKGFNAPEIRAKEMSEFQFKPIYFDYDKAELKSEFEAFLLKMIRIVNSHPDLRVQVTGNTDSDGTNEYNIDLSKRRAEAIIHFFEAQGIAVDRLIIDFKGENNPVDSNKTKEGKQKNRRVDFSFIYK
jgi:outer membrane protein OmpA-like peptidoglycan-associated protein